MNMVTRGELKAAQALAHFVEHEVLPGTGLDAGSFWNGLSAIYAELTTENLRLLRVRDEMQAGIDEWHRHNPGTIDQDGYVKFLRDIGYVLPEPTQVTITSENVDEEVAKIAAPQLVVPILNARFLLNAANARWGSLYDALYGTDAVMKSAPGKAYDPERGAAVIGWARKFLDDTVPLAVGSHADVEAYTVENCALAPGLADPSLFAGYRGSPSQPEAILLKHNGLHIEIAIDRAGEIGSQDQAGIDDIVLESALTSICDFEDSVAAVDAQDKVAAYANWLGLMKQELTAQFVKAGKTIDRGLNADRQFLDPRGNPLVLRGRSLLFVRNVGHLMTTPAVLLRSGEQAHEGILDSVLTSLIALHDLKSGARGNSRAGSIYIVKPKMHGPEEARFANTLFDMTEDMLGLERHTIKVGLMDEERRTSTNLAACIEALRHRIVFVNTGFLDRTGDEIHTWTVAGPVVRKNDIRRSTWIAAYEDRNVLIGLACGLSGRGQIGKGMWAAPDRMADMLEAKIGHPASGANTAWVPSPTAATLHATHYHRVDVFARQRELKTDEIPGLDRLLTPPLAGDLSLSDAERIEELDNNTQGILGYVVRWIDQGIGCSKVPDIHNVGLMEDRATLRISSQHIANWLLHGIVSATEVEDSLRRMAAKVDKQNEGDPQYLPMAGNEDDSIAFQAAQALISEGISQPNGYTEPLLHTYRARAKSRQSA